MFHVAIATSAAPNVAAARAPTPAARAPVPAARAASGGAQSVASVAVSSACSVLLATATWAAVAAAMVNPITRPRVSSAASARNESERPADRRRAPGSGNGVGRADAPVMSGAAPPARSAARSSATAASMATPRCSSHDGGAGALSATAAGGGAAVPTMVSGSARTRTPSIAQNVAPESVASPTSVAPAGACTTEVGPEAGHDARTSEPSDSRNVYTYDSPPAPSARRCIETSVAARDIGGSGPSDSSAGAGATAVGVTGATSGAGGAALGAAPVPPTATPIGTWSGGRPTLCRMSDTML